MPSITCNWTSRFQLVVLTAPLRAHFPCPLLLYGATLNVQPGTSSAPDRVSLNLKHIQRI